MSGNLPSGQVLVGDVLNYANDPRRTMTTVPINFGDRAPKPADTTAGMEDPDLDRWRRAQPLARLHEPRQAGPVVRVRVLDEEFSIWRNLAWIEPEQAIQIVRPDSNIASRK